jgi:hypothetical protein
MTARAKIEALTNTWYSFAVFTAITSALKALREGGLGFFTIAGTILWMLLSWAFVYVVGKRLLAKSSLTRAVLIVASAILGVTGGLACVKMSWNFITSWELSLLAALAYSGVSTWLNVKSFRTLTDPSVKAYFG